MSRKEPLDAILIDRVVQPVFDKIWHLTGLPSTLISFHAWLALTIFIIATALAKLYYGPDAYAAVDMAIVVMALGFNSITLRMRWIEHRKWLNSAFEGNEVRRLPAARYTHAWWRPIFLLISYGLILPHYVMMLFDPAAGAALDGLLNLVINAGFQIGIYSMTVAPPNGPPARRAARNQVVAGAA